MLLLEEWNMFLCPKCGFEFEMPDCAYCGYCATSMGGIWQLTNDPDVVTHGSGDQYIGYESIGEAYSGNRKHTIEYSDVLLAKEISKITGNGIFLDLGCGDGCLSVPVARFGTKVIAADISNSMLKILQQKARMNHVSLKNTVLCRMNALNITIPDDTIDCVVANSVLHLISRPEKVLNEIYRVLKPNGCFVIRDDQPGKVPDSPYDNTRYHDIVNELYALYWKTLESQKIYPQKYNWQFDRDSMCTKLFKSKEEMTIPLRVEYKNKLKDEFLPRFMGRGFSDQVNVPAALHTKAVFNAIESVKQQYGNDFDEIEFYGIESDLRIILYRK